MKFKVLTFLLLIDGGLIYAQSYLWPTTASYLLTSSFAEYRSGHFHAGIDIKTWNREGYPVLAVRAGYIWQVRVSPYGYGKVLYQRLDTGELAVYAHLSCFADKIQAIVEKEQQKLGKFSVTLQFNPSELPVEPGEVIAFTGQSGSGSPHLHFELRDRSNRPFNPLSRGYRVQDTIAPVITAISVTPLDAESQVNGDLKPLILKPVLKSSGYYVLKESFQVLGKIGLGVSCYDQTNQVENELDIYITRLYLDDSLRFTVQYDCFSYAQSQQIDLDRDYRLNWRGYGLFYKLYREQANTLDFYWPPDAGAGIINTRAEPNRTTNFPPFYDFMVAEDSISGEGFLSEGLHYFWIEVSDFYQNISTVSGQFIVGKWPTIEPKVVADDLGYFYLAGVEELGGKALTQVSAYLSRDRGETWNKVLAWPQPISSVPFSEEVAADGEPFKMKFLTKIPSSAEGTYILKIVAEDERGLLSLPSYRILKNQTPLKNKGAWIEIDKDFYDDYFRIELHATEVLLEKPQVIVQQEDEPPVEIELIPTDVKDYRGIYKFIAGRDGTVSLEAFAQDIYGRGLLYQEDFDITTITPDRGGKMTSRDGNCWVEFPPKSVYKPMVVRISELESQTSKFYDSIGNVYQIEPGDIPLKENVWVYLRYPEEDSLPTKLGVYGQSKKGLWVFSGNQLDQSRKTVSATVGSLNRYTLIRDLESPLIWDVQPGDGTHIKVRRPLIQVSIKDRLSGIRGEDYISLRLDGRKLISEYDPERHIVFYQVREPLALGRHTISVWAIDRCGNKAQAESMFWVE